MQVEELVRAAVGGDQSAWDALVARFSGLVWGVARSYRLSAADAADVSQTVWLRLVEHLARLREPAAVPGWLASTTRNECLRTLRRNGRELPSDVEQISFQVASPDPTPDLVAEQSATRGQVADALSLLSHRCQLLLRTLATWPDASYAEVAAALDMPIGSIGPTRARCLEHLRRRLVTAGVV